MRRRASGGDIHLPYSPWSKLLVRATAQLFDFQPGPAKFLVSNRVVGHVSAGLPIGLARPLQVRQAATRQLGPRRWPTQSRRHLSGGRTVESARLASDLEEVAGTKPEA